MDLRLELVITFAAVQDLVEVFLQFLELDHLAVEVAVNNMYL